MNCKPGDLAIVVRSKSGNEGKIVRCIRLCTPAEADAEHYWSGPLWKVDALLVAKRRGDVKFTPHCPDECLRPIRDPGDDAQDEMLRPLPNEVCEETGG